MIRVSVFIWRLTLDGMTDKWGQRKNEDEFVLFHPVQQACQSFKVAGIYLQVEQVAIAVEEFVGGPGVHIEVVLDG